MNRLVRTLFVFSCIGLIHASVFAQAPSASDKAFAEEEFRRGVQAFHRGAFNDAVLVFEKALSFIPGEPLILDWLGKSYFRTGVEGAALQQWQFALDAGYGGTLLSNRIEVVRERRTLRPSFIDAPPFVETASIRAKNENGILFRQPVSVAPLSDGSFWIAAYGSNEILRFDVNGIVADRSRGPVGGFDRPFDIIRLKDGRLAVTEVAADRVSVLSPSGSFLFSFGKKGRGLGDLSGPQFVAADDAGNFYVTDYGNARVGVYDPEGKPLFSFGTAGFAFAGFAAPAGIAFLEGRLYIADSVSGALHVFDTSGNYRETLLPAGSIKGAESLRVWNGYLLAALKNRVLVVDPASGASFDASRLGNAPMRITGAAPDANGNLILADYQGNTVQIVSRTNDLAGGLFVQIDRVHSDAFPKVVLEVRVEDRSRNPLVGLKSANFFVTEEKRPVADFQFMGAGYLEDSSDITVIVERSQRSLSFQEEIKSAIAEIAAAMKGKGTLRIISAGKIPVQEGSGPPDAGNFQFLSFGNEPSPSWSFDLALRLSVNDLVKGAKKRGVIFLTTGEVSPNGFNRYGLNDLAAYMGNNGVVFSAVYLDRAAPPGEYEYLVSATGGKSWYIWRNEGLSAAVDQLRTAANGCYVLSYTSALPTDFGRRFLPVEVESYLMNRSGRDETGYFAPLQ